MLIISIDSKIQLSATLRKPYPTDHIDKQMMPN